MSFWDKFGRGVAAFTAGVAQQLPGSLQTRNYARQEARYQERLDWQQLRARKEEIRNIANAGSWEEAMAQAQELGDPSFVAELQSLHPARTTGKRLGAAAAQAQALAGILPIVTPQERASTRATVAETTSGLAGAQQLMEHEAGIERVPAKIAVPGGGVQLGESISAQQFFGQPEEVRAGFVASEASRRALEQLGAGVGRLDQEIDAYNPLADAPQRLAQMDRIRQAFVSTGHSPDDFAFVERRLERAGQDFRDTFAMQRLPLLKDPAAVRSLAVRYGASPAVEQAAEDYAKTLERSLAENVPENVRWAWQQARGLLDTVLRVGWHDPVWARAQMDKAASIIEPFDPTTASEYRTSADAYIGMGQNVTMFEDLANLIRLNAERPDVVDGLAKSVGLKTGFDINTQQPLPIETVREIHKLMWNTPGKPTSKITPDDPEEIAATIKMDLDSTLGNREAFTRRSAFQESNLKEMPDTLRAGVISALAKINYTVDPQSGELSPVPRVGFTNPRTGDVYGVADVVADISLPSVSLPPLTRNLNPTPQAREFVENLVGVPAGMVERLPYKNVGRLSARATAKQQALIRASRSNVIKAAAKFLGVASAAVAPLEEAYIEASEELGREPNMRELLQRYVSGSALPPGTI